MKHQNIKRAINRLNRFGSFTCFRWADPWM